MTTTTMTGYRVTFSGTTATSVSAATLTALNTDSFGFRYTMDAPVTVESNSLSGMSSITLTAGYGQRLISTSVNGTRFSMNTAASIADFHWQPTGVGADAEINTLMMIDLGVSGEKFFFVLNGTTDLTAFASHTAFNSWLATVYQVDSVIGSNHPVATNKTLNWNYFPKTNPATSENDLINGNATLDDWTTSSKKLLAGMGNDTVNGTTNKDYIDGGVGDDSITGNTGDDSLTGSVGNDRLFGGVGNDSQIGDAGNDSLSGDVGNDSLNGGIGNDTVLGGDGNDTIDAGTGVDTVSGGAGNDKINASDGNDTVDGGDGNDSINGGFGLDSLIGGNGLDTLSGGDGNDRLIGGDGNDNLTGGTGIDFFYFSDTNDADRVTDFRDNQDKLYIDDNLGVASVSAAMSKARQVGANVVFDFGGGDTLTVQSIKMQALANDIVIF